MFGTYRTILALAVLLQHLCGIPLIGHYAVFGFFILSGYLMTSIMHKTYGYSAKGLAAFLGNRVLRLYPSYWVVCILSLVLIYLFGSNLARVYHPQMYWPDSLVSTIQNLTLIFPSVSPKFTAPRLSPPTWALTLEICYYVLIGLGVSRSKKMTVAWFFVSLAYVVVTLMLQLTHESRYSYIPAASLPFAIGGLLYHYKHESRKLAAHIPIGPYYLLTLYPVLVLISIWSPYPWATDSMFYINIVLQTAILVKLRDQTASQPTRRRDKLIGDLSYPIYLAHFQMGFIASMLLWGRPVLGFSARGLLAGSFAAVLTVVFAYVLNRILDDNVERLRRRVKSAAASTTFVQSVQP